MAGIVRFLISLIAVAGLQGRNNEVDLPHLDPAGVADLLPLLNQ